MRWVNGVLVVSVLLIAILVTALASARAEGPGLPPIPELDRWKARMLTAGRSVCNYLAGQHSAEELLSHVYYDAQRVFFQIADYTGDSSWNTCAQRAEAVYRDRYVFPNRGGVPGYWNFTHGLTMDYLRTGDGLSKEAVILLSQNAAFARDGTPLEWTAPEAVSREVAYAIMSYLNAEKVGAPPRARLPHLVDQALGHIDQWFVTKTHTRIAPFMVGLTAEALILYYEKTQDPRIPPAIRRSMDWLWENAWMAKQEAFWYDSRETSVAAPDLNLLIAPAYAWLYRQTGAPAYRERGDRIFAGGVKGAHLGHGKHFNQNYRWSFDYVRWRAGPPANSPTSVQGLLGTHGR